MLISNSRWCGITCVFPERNWQGCHTGACGWRRMGYIRERGDRRAFLPSRCHSSLHQGPLLFHWDSRGPSTYSRLWYSRDRTISNIFGPGANLAGRTSIGFWRRDDWRKGRILSLLSRRIVRFFVSFLVHYTVSPRFSQYPIYYLQLPIGVATPYVAEVWLMRHLSRLWFIRMREMWISIVHGLYQAFLLYISIHITTGSPDYLSLGFSVVFCFIWWTHAS